MPAQTPSPRPKGSFVKATCRHSQPVWKGIGGQSSLKGEWSRCPWHSVLAGVPGWKPGLFVTMLMKLGAYALCFLLTFIKMLCLEAGDEIVDLTCESLEPVVVDLTHNDSVVVSVWTVAPGHRL